MKNKCIICGKEFTSPIEGRLCCSPACFTEYHHDKGWISGYAYETMVARREGNRLACQRYHDSGNRPPRDNRPAPHVAYCRVCKRCYTPRTNAVTCGSPDCRREYRRKYLQEKHEGQSNARRLARGDEIDDL